MEASSTGPSGERLCDRHYNPTMAAAPGMVHGGWCRRRLHRGRGCRHPGARFSRSDTREAPGPAAAPAGRLLGALGRLVADSPPSDRPPGSNYLPNSNGEGGRVISSGDGNSSW